MTKRYRGQVAVDRLTLDVPAGSVFGLLGENGAGKTTTIQSLLGLIVPDEGRVETLGLDPVRRSLEVRRRVGYVPEQASLYDWMTVAEIGWFAAGFHPEPGRGPDAYLERYRGIVEGFALPPDRKMQAAFEGDAGQGRAGPGAGLGARAVDPRRADLGARPPGAPRVPGKHGRPGRRGADGAAVEPPGHRGRAGRQPRRAAAPGPPDPGRAARRPPGPDVPADPDVHRPRPSPGAPRRAAGRADRRRRRRAARRGGWCTRRPRRWRRFARCRASSRWSEGRRASKRSTSVTCVAAGPRAWRHRRRRHRWPEPGRVEEGAGNVCTVVVERDAGLLADLGRAGGDRGRGAVVPALEQGARGAGRALDRAGPGLVDALCLRRGRGGVRRPSASRRPRSSSTRCRSAGGCSGRARCRSRWPRRSD